MAVPFVLADENPQEHGIAGDLHGVKLLTSR
jgi:hypothetical protein